MIKEQIISNDCYIEEGSVHAKNNLLLDDTIDSKLNSNTKYFIFYQLENGKNI